MFQLHNVPNKLVSIWSRLLQFVKRVEHFKRAPASHVFVLMISAEQRNRKSYAVPVQCVPYVGLKENDVRNLVSVLCRQMIHYGMKISGMFNDHNCLKFILMIRVCKLWGIQLPVYKGIHTSPFCTLDSM